MPSHLRRAIKSGTLTEDQIKQLIAVESGMPFDDAAQLVDAGEAPDTIEWADVRLLLELLRVAAA